MGVDKLVKNKMKNIAPLENWHTLRGTYLKFEGDRGIILFCDTQWKT